MIKILQQLYIRFMVWLGAAPPPGYEYLLSPTPTDVELKPSGRYDASKIFKTRWNLFLWLFITIALIGNGILTQMVFSPASPVSPKYFPSTEQTIAYHGAGMTSGPLFLFMGTGLLILFIFSRRAGQTKPVFLILAVGFIGIGGIHFAAVYSQVAVDFLLRFDPNQVTEIQIQHFEQRNECPKLVISDKKLIADGFSQLPTAQVMQLSHESFSSKDGYLIEVVLNKVKLHYPYLVVYKYRGNGERVQVVAPFISIPTSVSEAFSSPKFHDWISKNVDPYFERCHP